MLLVKHRWKFQKSSRRQTKIKRKQNKAWTTKEVREHRAVRKERGSGRITKQDKQPNGSSKSLPCSSHCNV